MLTRMRQIALHPGLVPANYLEELRSAEANEGVSKPIVITPADRMKLQYVLAQAIEDCEECPVCFGVLLNDARITSCAHMFCLAWYDGCFLNLDLLLMSVIASQRSYPEILNVQWFVCIDSLIFLEA